MPRRGSRELAAAGALACCLAAPAWGAPVPARQTVTASATTATPGAVMGATVDAVYHDASGGDAFPHALRHVVDGLPVGTTIDAAHVAQCHADDAVLTLVGSAACPAASIVGGGDVTLDVGSAAVSIPVDATVTLINTGTQILFLGREPHTGIGLVDHGTIVGSAIDVAIPSVPGLGPEGAVVRRERFEIRASSQLLHAPVRCPRTGHWTFRRRHDYADGVRQDARVALPCARARRHRG